MLKFFIVISLTLTSAFSANAQGMRPMNEVMIVALIITSGEETPVSASVTNTLESLDAQVLTANAPNASQMRSILKRFASAALDVDVALVYYDGAVLKIGDREFVAPGGISLRRSSDLLTKAIPLSALARATALAGNGGAVLVHSSGGGVDLIDGVTLVEAAPVARTGTSPILFAGASAAESLAEGLASMATSSNDINLTDALTGLSGLAGVSISQVPTGTTMLRVLPKPEPEVAVGTAVEAEVAAPEAPETNTSELSEAIVAPADANLPQVGDATPEADTAADVAATVEALETDTESVEVATEAAEPAEAEVANAVSEEDTEAAAQVTEADLAADSELSIDVLRAMQGALTRGQKRSLQQKLRNLGHYRGLIDGIFGPQTARAISAYQESVGATVTGVMTPIQLQALSE